MRHLLDNSSLRVTVAACATYRTTTAVAAVRSKSPHSTQFPARACVAVLSSRPDHAPQTMRAAAVIAAVVAAWVCPTAADVAVSAPSTAPGRGGHNRPNILLLFPDEWRFDWDGLRNDSNATQYLNVPTLRKFAARGTRFRHAYVPAPVCSPSRSCLAAGREFDKAGVPSNFANDYPINQTTFYTLLQQAGYWTISTGKDDLTKASQLGSKTGQYLPYGGYHLKELGFSDGIRHSGKDDVIDKYPHPHEAYGYMLHNQTLELPSGTAGADGSGNSSSSTNTGVVGGHNKTVNAFDAHYACMKHTHASPLCAAASFPPELYEDNWVSANAVALLRRRPDKHQPWFMHVSFPGPHPPFLVTAGMGDSVSNRSFPPPVDAKGGPQCANAAHPHEPQLGDGSHGEGDRCNYAAEIENLDALFAQVLDEVEAQEGGTLDNTLVCISSDHGDMLGDHDAAAKSKPWEASVSVPLLCFGPDVAAGQVVDFPVATLDLAATFVDYAGGELAPNMTSRSLRSVLKGEADAGPRDFVASGLDNWRLVIQKQNLTSAATGPHGSSSSSSSSSISAGGGGDGRNETFLKYICCVKECPGAPSNVPKPDKNGFTQLLYDVLTDPFDMHNLGEAYPHIMAQMNQLLPEEFPCGRDGAHVDWVVPEVAPWQ